jgi:PAS domain S-box-containing protein
MPPHRRRRANKHEASYRAIDCLGYAILMADRSGTIEYANSAAHRLFGEAATAVALARALAGEHISDEEVFLHDELQPQGVWLAVSAAPRRQPDGHVIGAIALFRDVTRARRERDGERELLEAMQAGTRRPEALFEHALDAVLLADDGMRLVDANPSPCRLLGYSRNELLGMTVTGIAAPEHRIGMREQWDRFLQAGSAEGEVILASQSGNKINAEFRAVANILPSLHLSVIRDISARKSAEAGLRETQRDERTRERIFDAFFTTKVEGKGLGPARRTTTRPTTGGQGSERSWLWITNSWSRGSPRQRYSMLGIR